MTIHVLHAGDGYLYLTRSVAVQDARLGRKESLAGYYTASGQPSGRWMGSGARRLGVSGVVTEEQMRALFGEGMHPNATVIRARLLAGGASQEEARQATALGRRFPRYRPPSDLKALARLAYLEQEQRLGRPLEEEEKLAVRQGAATAEFERRNGRRPLDPVELEALGDGGLRREAVAGYDLVFTPVKSVAVLWGIGSAATRGQIFQAHQQAVADAVTWLEANAALTRTGSRGQAQVDTRGVTAALFHHWDSRAGDPDLHTHVAISNKVQGPDDKWRSLDGRALFAAAVSLSEQYNTRIEDELRTRLGVEFAERPGAQEGRRPVREIAGMPVALIEGFSKRRQGIEQQYQDLLRGYRSQHGREPADAVRHQLYQQATLHERPDKTRGPSLKQLVQAWQQEADTILETPQAGAKVERLVLYRPVQTPPVDVAAITDRVVDTLTASRATWNVHHVRAEAHRQSRQFHVGRRDQLVEEIVAAATDPCRVVRIETPRTVAEPVELRRADGESVFIEHASARFTTLEILDAEERIVAAARQHTGHRLDPTTVEAALTRAAQNGRPLNAGQAGMVRGFCLSGRAVQLGLAPAGSGKTTAMRVVAEAWTSTGRPMVALAPSAVAAEVLGSELRVTADTLAKFDHDRPTITPATMILIDEAGMAGTLVLDRLVRRAVEAGAVVRLLGDDQQLAAVEAGGVLRHLDHEVGAVRMHQVIRFTDSAEAAATLQVRDGDPAAVDFYLNRERVVAGTSATAPDAAYAAWLTDVRAGRDSLLLASTAAVVAGLNARARADLVMSGRVQVDGVRCRDGNAAGLGDQVATRRNDRRLGVNGGRDWVKNGDGWRVVAVHGDDALTVEHRRHHGRVTLAADYVQAHLELDYARTIRRAQGITVDHAHLLVEPQLSREDLYVGLSRARHGTRLYLATMTDPGPDHIPDIAGSARAVLAEIITRSGVEPSASEAIRAAVAGIGDLRRMAVEYEHAIGVHVGDRYRRLAEPAHPGICADPAWPGVARRLHLAEGAGWNAADILRRAEQMGSYADARSNTRVLAFRLDQILNHSPGRWTGADDPPPVPTWLGPAPPTRLAAPWDSYLPARYAEMSDRITTMASEASAQQPGWLGQIGDGPGRAEAVRQIVAYRAVYAVSCEDPLGPEPHRRSRQHQAWTAGMHAITSSQQPEPATRGAELLLAELNRAGPSCADDHRPNTDRCGPARRL